jgi:RloB-like protein
LTPRRRRGRPTRSVSRAAVRRQLLVYVEGERTEEDYVIFWYRRYRTQVRVTIADEHGVPMTLVDYAIAARREAEWEERRGRGAAWDEIWCVFDEDSHPNLDAAIAKAEANGIRLAVSNPCIELWFILHFEDRTAYIERRAAQSRARELLGCEKGLSDAALELLGERYDEARARAIALDAKHAGDGSPPRSNPSSEVWKLVDRIRYV